MNEKKHYLLLVLLLLLHAFVVWVCALSLSLSVRVRVCAWSSPRVNNTARTIAFRISHIQNQTYKTLNLSKTLNNQSKKGPQNVFPFVTTHLKRSQTREGKRGTYAKGLLYLPASIRAANDSAHSNHPDDFGFPKISSRVVVVFYRRSKRISSRFLSSGCLTRVQNPRAGHTGRVRARERMRKESNLIDWVMQNAVAWVRARAVGRECAVARRCRRRCFGRRSIFRTYF